MKLTTFIILMYVALLTVKPVAEQFAVSLTHSTEMAKMPCCKSKKNNSAKQDTKNCCDKKDCTAAGTCHCYFIAIQQQMITSFNQIIPNKESIIGLTVNFNSSFMADCFHPPKIA